MRMRMRISLNVAEGLAYMHSLRPPVLHRDIKSHNILVSARIFLIIYKPPLKKKEVFIININMIFF